MIEYPGLYAAASAGSKRAQTAFIRTTAIHLALLVVAAVLGAITGTGWGIGAACLLFVSMIFSIVLKLRKFDDRWFACRALAENVKSAVWFFVMDPDGDQGQARSRYHSELASIRNRFPEDRTHLAGTGVAGETVTQWMRESNALDLMDKRDLFEENRIRDQITWYTGKAAANGRNETLWGVSQIALELVAIGFALAAALKEWKFNPATPLAALAAAGVAWSQTKRFSDLATTYRVAAEDLTQIRGTVEDVTEAEGLKKLVEDVEHAISREHGIWRVKRGV